MSLLKPRIVFGPPDSPQTPSIYVLACAKERRIWAESSLSPWNGSFSRILLLVPFVLTPGPPHRLWGSAKEEVGWHHLSKGPTPHCTLMAMNIKRVDVLKECKVELNLVIGHLSLHVDMRPYSLSIYLQTRRFKNYFSLFSLNWISSKKFWRWYSFGISF